MNYILYVERLWFLYSRLAMYSGYLYLRSDLLLWSFGIVFRFYFVRFKEWDVNIDGNYSEEAHKDNFTAWRIKFLKFWKMKFECNTNIHSAAKNMYVIDHSEISVSKDSRLLADDVGLGKEFQIVHE